MEVTYIDLNCDVGEGMGNEEELMPYISSCNIACGGHSGNETTIRQVARLAKKYGVRVGAHPSYPDRENFGRISIDITEEALIESIQAQIESFKAVLKNEDIPMDHIKPHGALYNDVARDENLSKVFLNAVSAYKNEAILYVPCGSRIEMEALKKNFGVKREAFADRNYNPDLSLVSRTVPNAVIRDPGLVLDHLIYMVKERHVKTMDGNKIPVRPETYCVHGDTPEAIQIVHYLSEELPKRRICLKK